MRIFSLLLCLAISLILSSGCIHTYPDGEGVDPTQVEVSLIITPFHNWQDYTSTKTAGSRSTLSDMRIHIQAFAQGKSRIIHTHYVKSTDTEDNIEITIPKKFDTEVYNITIWADLVDPEDHTSLAYQWTDLSQITPTVPHGSESTTRKCGYAITKLDLTKYRKSTFTNVKEEISLTSPLARFRIVADDYESFISHYSQEIKKGESFNVIVSYVEPIYEMFSASENTLSNPSENVTFSHPLEILTIPGIEVVIASDCLFVDKTGIETEITLSLTDHTGRLISQTKGIKIPLRQGHITTLKGNFMSNFISEIFSIDSEWDGEITIELE